MMLVMMRTIIVITYGIKFIVFIIKKVTPVIALGRMNKKPKTREPTIARVGFQTQNITSAIASHPKA